MPVLQKKHAYRGGTKKFLLYFFAYLGILSVLSLFYANTLANPFIWDDEGLIVHNAFIRQGSAWQSAFTSDLYEYSMAGSNFYRPFQTLSFMLDYRLWGLNPRGYHLTNILLQSFVSFLVLLFLLSLVRRWTVAYPAALFFAVSPLHTEVVAYIAGRADMLMACFSLLSLLLFIRAQDAHTRTGIVLRLASLFCCACALFSKELAVVLPLIMSAWVYCYRRESFRARWYVTTALVPYYIVVSAYALLRYTVLRFSTLWLPELTKYPFWLRFIMLPKVCWAYLKLFIAPVGLHMSRTMTRPVTAGGISFQAFLSVLIIGALIYLVIRGRKNKTPVFLGVWAVLFFLPQSGIFPINAFVAEHFIYLPSVSFYAAVCLFFFRSLGRRAYYTLAALLVLVYGLLTMTRNYEWRDPVVFYQGIIRHSPASFLAHNNLGVEYVRRGLYEQAIGEFEEARQIKPERVEAYSNLADVHFRLNDYEASLRYYQTVEKLVPHTKAAEIQNNIGIVLQAQGDLRLALERFRLALRLDSRLNYVHFNSAKIIFIEGRTEDAVNEVILSFPEIDTRDFVSARYRQIIAGLLDQERESRCPAGFYNNLGALLVINEYREWGRVCFLRALELQPDFADAFFNLGLFYAQENDVRQARRMLREALKISPGHPRAQSFLESLSLR